MSKKTNHDILTAFEIYRDSVFVVDTDLLFWQSFLKILIDEYKSKSSRPDEVFSARFPVYNIDVLTNMGHLKTHKKDLSIKTLDLAKHSDDFFAWVTNLSILKIYNALEVFLFQAIQLRYFPNHKNPIDSKKSTELIKKEINLYLKSHNISVDKKTTDTLFSFLNCNQ